MFTRLWAWLVEKNQQANEALAISLIWGFVLGLLASFAVGPVWSLAWGLVWGLLASFAVGLIVGFVWGLSWTLGILAAWGLVTLPIPTIPTLILLAAGIIILTLRRKKARGVQPPS